MRSEKYILVPAFIAVFLMVLGMTGPINAAEYKTLIAPVVVEVNGDSVYETELLYFLIGRNGQEILSELIENAILAQKAKDFGVKIDPNLPKEEMLDVYGEEKFKSLSKAFDVDKILNAVKREKLANAVYEALIEKLVKDNNITITKDQALDYYLKNVDLWSRPPVARFSIIVTSEKQAAESALAKLKGGTPFSEVAQEFSTDKATKENGGDIGKPFPQGYFRGPLKKIEDAVFQLAINQPSEIIPIENNFFIVMPTERLPRLEKKFNEVEDYIMKGLTREKVDPLLKDQLAKYRDQSKIEVYYPVFDTTEGETKAFTKVQNLPPPTGQFLIYPTVVRVNGEDINEQEMLFFLIGRHGQEVLQELIENLAVSQQAKEMGVVPDDSEPDKILEKTYGKEKIAALSKAFNMDNVKQAIQREILAQKVFMKKKDLMAAEMGIKVTEADAKKYYDQNSSKWEVPERVRFSIIVTEKEEDMKKALDEIQKGKTFEETAKKYSIDDVTRDSGGDIGTLWPRGVFFGPFTELEDKIFQLKLGETSEVIFIQDRFYMVKVTEKKDKEVIPFEKVKDEIIDSMVSAQVFPFLQDWLTGIGKNSQITLKYPIFDVESELKIKAEDKLKLAE